MLFQSGRSCMETEPCGHPRLRGSVSGHLLALASRCGQRHAIATDHSHAFFDTNILIDAINIVTLGLPIIAGVDSESNWCH
jgi:hypothetical protein